MGLFDFFKEEPAKIDYETVGKIINGVVEKLNEYMIDVPEVVLDQTKQKNLLKEDGTIDNKYRINLASYYCAILEWYCSNKRASEGIVKYIDDTFPFMDKKIAQDMFNKSADQSKKAEHAFLHFTESLMNLQIATHVKRMNGSSRTIAVAKMPEAMGDTVLNEYFNQKCSDFNRTLLRESLNKIIEISK